MKHRRRRLLEEFQIIETPLVITKCISLDKAKDLLFKGKRAIDIIQEYHLLPADKVELFSFEDKLNRIDNNQRVIYSGDKKKHDLRFVTKMNDFKNNTIDPISTEIKEIFSSNGNLFDFCI